MPEHNTAPLGKRHGPINWEYANAAARTGASGILPADIGKWARQLDNNTVWELTDDSPLTWLQITGAAVASGSPFEMIIACSDQTTALTTGAAKETFRMPRAVILTAVRASLITPQTSGSIFTVDINEDGSTILSTKITIDNGEETSVSAATPPVISDPNLADDAKMTVDIDQVGDGTAKGLKITLIGTRV